MLEANEFASSSVLKCRDRENNSACVLFACYCYIMKIVHIRFLRFEYKPETFVLVHLDD